LVQSDWEAWKTWRGGDKLDPPPPGTDRGRYLFVRLRILGQLRRPTDAVALATPSISGLYTRFPRPSMLAHLPARWSRREETRDPAGALFVERYLAMFERVLTDMEVQLEDLPRLLNPRTAPGPWLDWIATWLNLAFDPSWDVDRRRALVREAVSLYRMRGTPKGLARYVEIYTGLPPTLVEGFTTRPMGQALTLNQGALGTLPLGPAEEVDPDQGAHSFEIFATLGRPEDLELTQAVVRRIVESEKPAHTDYTLHMVLPDARVGCQSTVGVDLVLGHGVASSLPICGDLSQGPTQPILGSTLVLGQPSSSSSPSPTLDQAGVVVDDTFLLT
jgi:phage tail-like protein